MEEKLRLHCAQHDRNAAQNQCAVLDVPTNMPGGKLLLLKRVDTIMGRCSHNASHTSDLCFFFFFFTSPGQRVSRVHFRSFVRFATRQKDVILKVRHKGQLVLPDMISF